MESEVLSDTNGEPNDILKKSDIKRFAFSHRPVRSAVFLNSDDLLVTSSTDNSVDIWNLHNSELLKSMNHVDGSISQVRATPDAKQLIGSGMDACLYFWDLNTAQPIWIRETDFSLLCCDVSKSDHGLLVTGSDMNHTIMFWDRTTGSVVHRVSNLFSHSVTSVEFSSDGNRLAAASTKGPAIVYDLRSQRKTLTLQDDSVYISDLAFAKDGRNLLTTAMNGRLSLFDLSSGGYRMNSERTSLDMSIEIPSCYTCCGFSNSEVNMFACGASDGRVLVWDGWKGEVLLDTIRHGSIVTNCEFAPSGRSLLTTYADGKGQLWNLDELVKIRKFRSYEKTARRSLF